MSYKGRVSFMGEQFNTLLNYAAYIPCYDGGNSVIAVKKDGQTITLNKSIKSVMRMLIKESSLDINAFRQNFSGLAGKSNLIPIPLSLDIVLIPLKVRKAIGKNDGCYAYVDMSCIKHVSGHKPSVAMLSCGMELKCLESAKSVKQRINVANMVKIEYALKLRGDINLKEDMSRIIKEYGKVANMTDIMMLVLDIFKLSKKTE